MQLLRNYNEQMTNKRTPQSGNILRKFNIWQVIILVYTMPISWEKNLWIEEPLLPGIQRAHLFIHHLSRFEKWEFWITFKLCATVAQICVYFFDIKHMLLFVIVFLTYWLSIQHHANSTRMLNKIIFEKEQKTFDT